MIETQMGQGVAQARGPRRTGGAPSAPPGGVHPLRAALLSRVARPLRFALTGGLAGLLQLGLLALLTGRGWPAALANAVAFLLAAQVNFALSTTLAWRDRRTPMEATILCIFAVTLYSIVALALIILPLRFADSPGEDRR